VFFWEGLVEWLLEAWSECRIDEWDLCGVGRRKSTA
jgi:hypothetical protein